jgi:hypothetical protein
MVEIILKIKNLTFSYVFLKNSKLQRNYMKFRDTEFSTIPLIFANSVQHMERIISIFQKCISGLADFKKLAD